jgi:hypothetical protein
MSNAGYKSRHDKQIFVGAVLIDSVIDFANATYSDTTILSDSELAVGIFIKRKRKT